MRPSEKSLVEIRQALQRVELEVEAIGIAGMCQWNVVYKNGYYEANPGDFVITPQSTQDPRLGAGPIMLPWAQLTQRGEMVAVKVLDQPDVGGVDFTVPNILPRDPVQVGDPDRNYIDLMNNGADTTSPTSSGLWWRDNMQTRRQPCGVFVTDGIRNWFALSYGYWNNLD